MKIVDGFKLRKVLGESVVVGEGVKQVNFNKLISLNETAALLWEYAQEKEFSKEDLVQVLLDNYKIDKETAQKDVDALITKWIEVGLVKM